MGCSVVWKIIVSALHLFLWYAFHNYGFKRALYHCAPFIKYLLTLMVWLLDQNICMQVSAFVDIEMVQAIENIPC